MPQIAEIREIDGEVWARVGKPGDFPSGVALWTPDEQEAVIRAAREEERARCAGIARQEFAETPGYSGAGDIIARAIEADPNLQKMQIAPSERAGGIRKTW